MLRFKFYPWYNLVFSFSIIIHILRYTRTKEIQIVLRVKLNKICEGLFIVNGNGIDIYHLTNNQNSTKRINENVEAFNLIQIINIKCNEFNFLRLKGYMSYDPSFYLKNRKLTLGSTFQTINYRI